jgi:hypothetical protein
VFVLFSTIKHSLLFIRCTLGRYTVEVSADAGADSGLVATNVQLFEGKVKEKS